MSSSGSIRVITVFVSSANEQLESQRFTVTDPDVTVRRFTMDALLRLSKIRKYTGDSDLAVIEASVDGEFVLYHGDKLLEALSVEDGEKLFLKLNAPEAELPKRAVAYMAPNPSAKAKQAEDTKTVTQQQPDSVPPPPAPTAPAVSLPTDVSMDLSSGRPTAPVVAAKKPATHEEKTPKEQTEAHKRAEKERLRKEKEAREQTRREAKKPAPKPPKQNLSDIPVPVSQPVGVTTRSSKRLPGEAPTPEEAKVVTDVDARMAKKLAQQKGEGWNEKSFESYPSNYQSDPDKMAREAKKRKREEAEKRKQTAGGSKQTAVNVDDKDILPQKAVKKEQAATATVNRPLFDESDFVIKVGEVVLAKKANSNEYRNAVVQAYFVEEDAVWVQFEHENDAVNLPRANLKPRQQTLSELNIPSVSPAMSDYPNPTNSIQPGAHVKARVLGGSWYNAIVLGVNEQEGSVAVQWTGTEKEDLVLRKDVKFVRAASLQPQQHQVDEVIVPLAPGALVDVHVNNGVVRPATVKMFMADTNSVWVQFDKDTDPVEVSRASVKPRATMSEMNIPSVSPAMSDYPNPPNTIAAGARVKARLLGGSWYSAVVVAVNDQEGSVAVKWAGTEKEDLVLKKDVKIVRVETPEENRGRQTMPAAAVLETTEVKSEEPEGAAITKTAIVTSENDLGWGANAQKEFDINTYIADPSKAHKLINPEVLNAPRSRRIIQTPEAIRQARLK